MACVSYEHKMVHYCDIDEVYDDNVDENNLAYEYNFYESMAICLISYLLIY